MRPGRLSQSKLAGLGEPGQHSEQPLRDKQRLEIDCKTMNLAIMIIHTDLWPYRLQSSLDGNPDGVSDIIGIEFMEKQGTMHFHRFFA